ncbi:MAG: acylneuraminate cytidylyltransferase family protein [Clostridia bacterium]|nr:acylneuraminate cytidylyltransferase family protein [Clostridia bacterium]
MKNLAIIPARAGSKGLPDKNIKKLCNKPLLFYSIEAAIKSGCFDTVMVSTDSEKYAEIAREGGAEVPFLRSEATSSDTASSWDMVLEVLERYEEIGKTFDTFCLLQPTSPLRSAADITEAYKIMLSKNAFSIVSITELEHPLSWCGTLGEENSLEGFLKETVTVQRQAQEKYYRPNGAIYIASVDEFREEQFLYRSGSYAYIMPKERSVDIDTEFDFNFAEFLLLNNSANNKRGHKE